MSRGPDQWQQPQLQTPGTLSRPAVSGLEYAVSETMAPGSGSSLNVYTSNGRCIDQFGTFVASGAGTGGTFEFASPTEEATTGWEVTCTFTHTPPSPEISLAKTAFPTAFGGPG